MQLDSFVLVKRVEKSELSFIHLLTSTSCYEVGIYIFEEDQMLYIFGILDDRNSFRISFVYYESKHMSHWQM